ncbi:hypothetical protein [Virgibacillus tibetensis]|uniref:hypothetical protein n=1 Tax=Virgibacillus tibetensis TaxID=3042313 RepID=UPI002E195687
MRLIIKRVLFFIILCIVSFSVLVACSLLEFRQPHSPQEPVDLEASMELVLKAAKKHPEIDFTPENVTLAGSIRPPTILSDVQFMYVRSELGHTENSPFAVTPDGSVFKLPEEFHLLLRKKELIFNDHTEVEEIVEFYLQFDIKMPSQDKHIILNAIVDIPGIEKNLNLLEELKEIIHTMKVHKKDTEWIVEFFTWQAVGGVVFHWEVQVKDGDFTIIKKDQLETNVGEYIMIE